MLFETCVFVTAKLFPISKYLVNHARSTGSLTVSDNKIAASSLTAALPHSLRMSSQLSTCKGYSLLLLLWKPPHDSFCLLESWLHRLDDRCLLPSCLSLSLLSPPLNLTLTTSSSYINGLSPLLSSACVTNLALAGLPPHLLSAKRKRQALHGNWLLQKPF